MPRKALTCARGPANQRWNGAHDAANPRVHNAHPLHSGDRHSYNLTLPTGTFLIKNKKRKKKKQQNRSESHNEIKAFQLNFLIKKQKISKDCSLYSQYCSIFSTNECPFLEGGVDTGVQK
jgi:hypothetical protein